MEWRRDQTAKFYFERTSEWILGFYVKTYSSRLVYFQEIQIIYLEIGLPFIFFSNPYIFSWCGLWAVKILVKIMQVSIWPITNLGLLLNCNQAPWGTTKMTSMTQY